MDHRLRELKYASVLESATLFNGQFTLGDTNDKAVDILLGAIKAEWMSTTLNVLLKINSTLDTLHALFDWRYPGKLEHIALDNCHNFDGNYLQRACDIAQRNAENKIVEILLVDVLLLFVQPKRKE